MAPRGSSKARSIDHEEFIASRYGGRRNAGSGALDRETGDVETARQAFECKTTGEPGKPAKSSLITRMEKITDEAQMVGKLPALALRFFAPDSPLADRKGFVDLVVRRVADDEMDLD